MRLRTAFPDFGLGFCVLYSRTRILTACNGSLAHRNIVLHSFVVHRHCSTKSLSYNPPISFQGRDLSLLLIEFEMEDR